MKVTCMWKSIFIGRPLTLKNHAQQTVTKKEALALLSSDALSSVAYGPEQILIILFIAGAMNMMFAIPITILIVLLLLLLVIAYQKVIALFPEGGGAYKVARTFIGEKTALASASLLLVDYILTIAVSTSAGVDALIAAVPSMDHYRIFCVIVFTLLLLLLNLRGTSETSKVLLVPVYGFIALLIGIIIAGFFNWSSAPVLSDATVQGLSILLLVKAFAVGCSALTGVEAISNAVPTFKEPAARNAQKTLLYLGILLALLFSAIMILSTHFHLQPTEGTTVLSSLAEHVAGRGMLYFVFQAATICILLLAANTSFTAFPQLLANLAKDGYAPRIFLNRGDRLGYSNSMIFLALAAIICSICFQGNTEMLIPLYAVGVFIPFSIALFGLALHLKGVQQKIVPLLAATLTTTVVVTLFITKALYVWPVVIFVPLMMYVLLSIKKHYDQVQLTLQQHYTAKHYKDTFYVLPIGGISATTEKAIASLQSKHEQCVALYVASSEEERKQFEVQWQQFAPNIRLICYYSSNQHLLYPLLRGIHKIHVVTKQQQMQLCVVIPQLVVHKKWHTVLHNHHAFALKQSLLHSPDITVMTVAFSLEK